MPKITLLKNENRHFSILFEAIYDIKEYKTKYK